MAPVIAQRRRSSGLQPLVVEQLLTHAGYSKAMWDFLSVAGIDADFLYREDLRSDSVVLDVGSYTGETVDRFLALYGCRIHAFEPHPGQVARLRERFANEATVTVHEVGLGGCDREMELVSAGPGSTLYPGHAAGSGTSRVEIRDVVAMIDELGLERIDLLKLNIEGAEFDLLDRLLRAGRARQVRYLLVQFHEWHPHAYRRRLQIRRALRATHDEVWNFPWVWELWCLRSEPHPYDPEQRLRALLAEREAG
jgi:FkbM family methyltransferase